jgi:hypothetical protein
MEELGVHDVIMLKPIIQKYNMNVWIEFSWLRIESSCGPFGTSPSVIKSGNFLAD